jgi:hypothetical protein
MKLMMQLLRNSEMLDRGLCKDVYMTMARHWLTLVEGKSAVDVADSGYDERRMKIARIGRYKGLLTNYFAVLVLVGEVPQTCVVVVDDVKMRERRVVMMLLLLMARYPSQPVVAADAPVRASLLLLWMKFRLP